MKSIGAWCILMVPCFLISMNNGAHTIALVHRDLLKISTDGETVTMVSRVGAYIEIAHLDYVKLKQPFQGKNSKKKERECVKKRIITILKHSSTGVIFPPICQLYHSSNESVGKCVPPDPDVVRNLKGLLMSCPY